MCGITGIVSTQPLTPDHIEQVSQQNHLLSHRGPDGEGDYRDTHVALAMRRLSIIDLTGGWQPLYNEDRSLAILANGEIYNYIELQQELQARGHQLRTGSDIETILHLYEEYGLDCVHHLRGMYAFALWDTHRQRLMLARDRMGEKPLYLYQQDGTLVFASEIKALLRSGVVPFELDPVSVDQYFYYHYVPEPRTPIAGVRKLPAGHFLVVDVDPWRVQESCYWRMEDAPPLEGDPAQLIRDELERVSEIVIRSDVPVGVALSGGMDSSAVAAMATQKYPGTMHAFSIGYTGRPESDERADAKALAEHLKIPFHDVELDVDEMLELFPQLIYWRDDPIADISGFGYYAVMRAARQAGVPVMLQGQGGDELFWGYDWVRQALRESQDKIDPNMKGLTLLRNYLNMDWLPDGLAFRKQISPWLKSMAGLRSSWQHYQRHVAGGPDRLIFYNLSRDFDYAVRHMNGLYSQNFRERLNGTQAYEPFTVPQPWSDLSVLITRLISMTYLLENGIAQGDRLGMASSVELRLPLLDYRFVETVVGLRKTYDDHHLPPKSWLKSALEGVLPDWVMNRPKRGFEPPVRAWHADLFARYGDQLQDGYLVQSGVLSPRSARELSSGPFSKFVVVPLSFKALVLELWARQMGVTV